MCSSRLRVYGLGGFNKFNHDWQSIQFYDDAFITKGNHSMKVGGAFENMHYDVLEQLSPNGRFNTYTLAKFLANAPNKLNALALWRTKANFDLGLELHYVSSVTWTERSFDVTQEGGVIFTPYGLPSYTMINGRVGYWWIREKLETGVAVYNLLGDSHREHPFGNEIGRRVLFSATGSF